MRFLFYTDCHVSGQTPRHRLDNFPQAITAKLREVYALAVQEGCAAVLFGGDFFNTHRVYSYETIADVMDVVCNSPLQTYAAMGEHDLYGHSPLTYPSSTLAFMVRRCPNFKVLWEPQDLGDVVLHGKHEWEDIHAAMARSVDKSKLNILLCHELLSQKDYPFEIFKTEQFAECPYDVVLSGDLHDGYQTHEVNGKWFCNPGSLARRTTADAYRLPQVALVDVERGKLPYIVLKTLPGAKRGEDVFGLSATEIAKAQETVFDLTDFAAGLEQLEGKAVDIYELVDTVGRTEGVSPKTLAYIASKRSAEE